MAFVANDLDALEEVFALARVQLTNSNPKDKQSLYNLLMLENRYLQEIKAVLPKEEVAKLQPVKDEAPKAEKEETPTEEKEA